MLYVPVSYISEDGDKPIKRKNSYLTTLHLQLYSETWNESNFIFWVAVKYTIETFLRWQHTVKINKHLTWFDF